MRSYLLLDSATLTAVDQSHGPPAFYWREEGGLVLFDPIEDSEQRLLLSCWHGPGLTLHKIRDRDIQLEKSFEKLDDISKFQANRSASLGRQAQVHDLEHPLEVF